MSANTITISDVTIPAETAIDLVTELVGDVDEDAESHEFDCSGSAAQIDGYTIVADNYDGPDCILSDGESSGYANLKTIYDKAADAVDTWLSDLEADAEAAFIGTVAVSETKRNTDGDAAVAVRGSRRYDGGLFENDSYELNYVVPGDACASDEGVELEDGYFSGEDTHVTFIVQKPAE